MEEPIVAIATGNINSAIGMIRLSGRNILDEVNKILDKPLLPKHDHRVVFRRIIINGKEYDHGMVIYYQSPHSYTGEDSVEITLHGNILNLEKIVEAIIQHTSCRLALPGEFTRRAFLNGKIDLTQAEAVAELISAESELALDISRRHLDGSLKSYMKHIRHEFIQLISLVEVELDFAEEDLEFVSREQLKKRVSEIRDLLDSAYRTYQLGKYVRQGIRISILGIPNAGKSTLLNSILGRERAIVSPTPGTTRDYIEERIHWNGFLIHLVDTAGLREAEDTIEMAGIQYSLNLLGQSDIVIYLFDPTQSIPLQIHLFSSLQPGQHVEKIGVLNKMDLIEHSQEILRQIQHQLQIPVMTISAREKQNIHQLLNLMVDTILRKFPTMEQPIIITSIRQADAIRRSIEALNALQLAIDQNMTSEILAFEIRQILAILDEITGEITSEDILNNIFSSFCIGK